jgi:hypothetical protein
MFILFIMLNLIISKKEINIYYKKLKSGWNNEYIQGYVITVIILN